jgi:PAS domain-containing protein
MTTTDVRTPNWGLEQFCRHLSDHLPHRCVRVCEESAPRSGTDLLRDEQAENVLRIEGDPPFRVVLAASSTGREPLDLRVTVDGGRTRHFPCVRSGDGTGIEMQDAARAVATFLLDEFELNWDVAFAGQSSSEVPPHVPVLLLNGEGTIQNLTESARRLLGYSRGASIEPCFFSHVHKKNLRRVMYDLAHMVSQRKKRARWLLRLRTGNDRWRWFRIRATCVSSSLKRAARLFLQRL